MPRNRLPENEGLPTRWKFQHGAYYYRVPPGDEKQWGGTKMYRLGKTLEEAQETFRTFQKEGVAPIKVEECRNFRFKAGLWEHLGYKKECGIPLSALQEMYRSARRTGPARDLPFSIHPKDIIELANKSGGRCMLTGIKWDFEMTSSKSRRPWVPSLDRIDSMKGYERGNIRMVCSAVNIALNEFGDKVLRRIAVGLLESDTSRAG